MARSPSVVFFVLIALGIPAHTQNIAQLREQLEQLKAEVKRLEATLDQAQANNQSAQAPNSPPSPSSAPPKQAPALNSPSFLPSRAGAYRKNPPAIGVLLQTRADFFPEASRNSTFFLRKAEISLKGHVSDRVDFRFELDPVKPEDPFRRTYIQLSHLRWLHLKMGMEKAPIGLEELLPSAEIPFVDRSEVNDRFAAAEELGLFLDSRWAHWLLQFSVTNGGRRVLRDNNDQKDITARIVWGPTSWISVGLATLQGTVGKDERTRDRYNAEFKLGSNVTGFQSELYRAKDGDVWSSAFYVEGFWAIPVNWSWMTHVQPALRYEHIGRTDHDAGSELSLLTAGLNFMFDRHRSKFQLNYLKDLHTGKKKDEIRAQYQVEF